MNSIKLSFCIPTYNRATTVYKVVSEILQYENFDIEVVILDNASTDNTLEILKTINDRRLIIYSNAENKGSLYNCVNVINKARGEYVIFSTDKDHTKFNEIAKFKSFINNNNLSGGYCSHNSKSEIDYFVFEKGYDAIKNVAYKGVHPTGYFFHNTLLKSIKHIEKYSDSNMVGEFPFEFILAELCTLGNGAVYNIPMFSLETGDMAAKNKSFNNSGDPKKAFFSPEERLKLAINYTKQINTLNLTPREKYILIIDVFVQQLLAATIIYRSIIKNRNICIHYHLNCQYIDNIEIVKIGLHFYNQYALQTSMIIKSLSSNKLNFNLQVCLLIFRKVINRIWKYLK